MSKSFSEQVSEGLGKSQTAGHRQAYRALQEIAEGIGKALNPGASGAFEVVLEPGYTTNLGQQFRIRLHLPARQWEETLFRAYIPPDGFPVSLDLDGEEPVQCAEVAELQKEVLDFLQKPEIDNRLSIVRESI